MATVRKNQRDLSKTEQQAFVAAVNALHGTSVAPPAYRAFVQVHADAMSMSGMGWHVHTMGRGMPGTNFLTWHRHFLLEFEHRLQQVDPAVSLPYWDWIADPSIPAFLDKPSLLTSWSVTRSWDPSWLATSAELDLVMANKTYSRFQRKLETGPHNDMHNAVGGTMDSSSSPADPLFWLHHANIDRLWVSWQQTHASKPKGSTVLQPPPLFGVKVSSQLDIAVLGYRYA